MKARTEVVVGTGGRLERLDCRPPLTIRRVHSDDPDVCALCLVGTAAGPLAGDVLELDLEVRDGARATLTATGASLAQGGGGARRVRTTVRVGSQARLSAQPQPLIAAAGSRVDIAVGIDLADTAAVDWQELLVLGRSGEAPGAATLRWDVTRAGRPVLRQFLDLADPALVAWRGMIDGARVIATAFRSDPLVAARTVVRSPWSVAAMLDVHTLLLTVLGSDVAAVRRELADLRALAITGTSQPVSTLGFAR